MQKAEEVTPVVPVRRATQAAQETRVTMARVEMAARPARLAMRDLQVIPATQEATAREVRQVIVATQVILAQ
jgi:hypothetical protein